MGENYPRRPAMEKVLDNILFLEEVFADRTSDELPDVPFLELAKSFELKPLGRPGQPLDGMKP